MDALLASPQFAAGCWFGLAAFAAGLAAALAWRSGRRPPPVPISGLLFAGATAAAIGWTLGLPPTLLPGLLALACAGAASQRPWARPLAIGSSILGGWLVTCPSRLALDGGLRLLVAVAVAGGGWLAADLDHRWRSRALGPLLLALTVGGVYATVPDTEQALAALGVMLPMAGLAWPWPLASLGRAGTHAAVGALLWVVTAGGAGRPSSVVGGIACLGLLVVEPLARIIDPRHRGLTDHLPAGRWVTLVVVTAQLGLVYVAARVAGLRATVSQAAVIAGVELVVAVAVCLAVRAGRPVHQQDAVSAGDGH